MPIKLLAVGDLHLGSRPGRLPSGLVHDNAELGPAGAWQRIIELAEHESVTAVLLAGDVVEAQHDFFEALPLLRSGITRLAQAGIRVLGVAGNHDGKVLPALTERVAHFELLGEGAQWQSAELEADGERLTLWGWSFPDRFYRQDPTTAFPGRDTPHPTLGLLHCDLDQSDTAYAPVAASRLRDLGLDGWLLGHIHRPDALSPSSLLGYLGTATGLDISEWGPRGPWLLSVQQGAIHTIEQRVIAPLRWEHLIVDVTEADSAQAITDRLTDALEALAADLSNCTRQPDAVGLRVRYTGTSDLPDTAFPERLGDQATAPLPGAAHIPAFIESIRIEVLPPVSLTALARREDHPGLLARRLLVLDRPSADPERQALLEAADEVVQQATATGSWRRLTTRRADTASPDSEVIAEWLRQAALKALRAMLAQRDSA